MVVFANVIALAGQCGAIGKAMVHQDAEKVTVEPSHCREAARVVEGGCGGGVHPAPM
jgi:hypothetical protein